MNVCYGGHAKQHAGISRPFSRIRSSRIPHISHTYPTHIPHISRTYPRQRSTHASPQTRTVVTRTHPPCPTLARRPSCPDSGICDKWTCTDQACMGVARRQCGEVAFRLKRCYITAEYANIDRASADPCRRNRMPPAPRALGARRVGGMELYAIRKTWHACRRLSGGLESAPRKNEPKPSVRKP